MAEQLDSDKKKSQAKVDPEMLKNLDLLMNYELLQAEEDLQILQEMDGDSDEGEDNEAS